MIPDKIEEDLLMYLSNGLIEDLLLAALSDDDADWIYFEGAVKDYVGQCLLNSTK